MEDKDIICLDEAIASMVKPLEIEHENIQQPGEEIDNIFKQRIETYPVTKSITIKKIKINFIED